MEFLAKIKSHVDVGHEISELLNTHKVIHMVDCDASDPSDFWFNQALKIGLPINMDENKNDGNKNGNFWIDVKFDKNFQSCFVHSNTRQPLHTDGAYESNPPNITFFFCIQKASYGGSTTFVDPDLIKSCLRLENPNLLQQLETTPVRFFKGEDSSIQRVFDKHRCAWNYFRAEKNQMVEDFHSFLESRFMQLGLIDSVFLNQKEALFFRDDKVFHGRMAFIGDRWLRKGGILWKEKS